MSREKKQRNIGMVSFPSSKRESVPLANLTDILCAISDSTHIITGNKGNIPPRVDREFHIYEIKHKERTKTFARVLTYIWTQLRISCKLMRLTRNVDLWIFFIGGEGLALPMLTAKLLRKNVVIASAGSGFKVAQAQKDPLARALALLQNVTYRLSDKIIIYSERLIEQQNLQKYRNKISMAQKHFLDFDEFKAKKKFDERDNLIGYIGALSKAKGVPNLLEAIPRVLARKSDVEFVIGGDGQLKGKVEKYLDEENLDSKARFVGWIPHDELPKYLNNLKLLILPSYTEGLPNIILEAMACGTPVLATPVGGIPDVIKDGETGFIMENNSPECIARNVIRALSHPDLGKIAKNARALVEKEYTYEKAVERYREVLDTLDTKQDRT